MKFFDLSKQYKLIKNEIDHSLRDVFKRGDFILGKEVSLLETNLSNFVGSKYCISTSSGTDALILSLMALEIKPGDEVITPAFSYIACAEAIRIVGATPVFVDVDPFSFNINSYLIEEKINKNTKAIMPVSLYGYPYDYKKINRIAKKHNLKVIEDASQSYGSQIDNKYSSNLSDIGCTSFFPTKPLGCYGDGGAIFTNSSSLKNKLMKLRSHGQPKKYEHELVGLNARLDTIQASILLNKLKIFQKEIELRQVIATTYKYYLKKSNIEVVLPEIPENIKSVFAQYTIKVKNRSKLISKLKNKNIPVAIHYPKPVSEQVAYNKFKLHTYEVSEQLSKEVLSLPFHPYLKEVEIKKIVNSLA